MKKNFLLLRKFMQLISFTFFVFVIWQTRYPLNIPINLKFFFQFNPFVMIITSISERIFITGLFFALITILFTFSFGRFFCGWICPLGATFDFFSLIVDKFKLLVEKNLAFKRVKSGSEKESKLVYVKYFIFFVIFVFAIFGYQYAWVLDPITIFVRTFSFNIFPFVNKIIINTFAYLLKITNYSDTIDSIYQFLKNAFLETRNIFFPHVKSIFIFFIFLLFVSLLVKRFWCRYLCPLGGMLALISIFSPFRRVVKSCSGNCRLCKNICRMNAIKEDNSYVKQECILCLDCIYLCPGQKSTFSFKNQRHSNLRG